MHKIIEAADTLGGKIAMTVQWPDGSETVEIVGENAARGLGYHYPDEPAPLSHALLSETAFEILANIRAFERDCEEASGTDVDDVWAALNDYADKLSPLMSADQLDKLEALRVAHEREIELDRKFNDRTITPLECQERSKMRFDRGVRFKVGEIYFTMEGKAVTVLQVKDECFQGDDISENTGEGIWRYSRRGDIGRVTGTAHDFSDPRNLLL